MSSIPDDMSDIFGEPEPKPKRRGKRVEHKFEADDPDLETLPDGVLPDPSEFLRPVRVTFLATIFQTEPRRLHKKLVGCPVIGWENYRGGKVPIYDFRQAVQYIVDPKLDIATWIRTQQPHTLPVHINKAFWEAENSRLRWMERARHYWHDDDVLDVFGRTAMAIKETVQLWIENLPGKASMTTEQYEALRRNATELLDDLHQRLVEIPKERRTESVVRSLDEVTAQHDAAALEVK